MVTMQVDCPGGCGRNHSPDKMLELRDRLYKKLTDSKWVSDNWIKLEAEKIGTSQPATKTGASQPFTNPYTRAMPPRAASIQLEPSDNTHIRLNSLVSEPDSSDLSDIDHIRALSGGPSQDASSASQFSV